MIYNMKKLFLFAAAIAVVASCTNDTVVSEGYETPVKGELKAITFNSFSAATTRATGATAADMLGDNFVVEGVKSDGTVASQVPVFDHYNVNWSDGSANSTTSNSSGWEYVGQAKHAHASIAAQTIKYWDYAKSQYDFIAFSKGDATAVYDAADYVAGTNVLVSKIDASKIGSTDAAYTIKGQAADLAKVYIADLVTVYRDGTNANDALGDYNKTVRFNFRSLSAKVRIALYETVPGYSVKDVVFYTAEGTKATDGNAHLYTTGTEVFNTEGTYSVYFETTGKTNKDETDYNKAHLRFAAETDGTTTDMDFGALDGTNTYVGEELNEDGDATLNETDKLYIARSSNTATYAGENTTANPHYYTIVIPNETGAVLNLKVDYTLVSTDGNGETIKVTGAKAQVPATYAAWKSGYAYTYIFKISQDTNGLTNPDITGIAGLYPITFDAVVTETEDGVQETITTVASPSITTYSKGVVATENNEYKTNKNIYVMVAGVTNLSDSNAKMYKITPPADGAAQTVNEASVANLLANGTNTGGTWTVTDANGKTMSASVVGLSFPGKIAADDAPDGNEITVNCALFNTTIAGTYAFEYNDGTKKHYKIIKVVN